MALSWDEYYHSPTDKYYEKKGPLPNKANGTVSLCHGFCHQTLNPAIMTSPELSTHFRMEICNRGCFLGSIACLLGRRRSLTVVTVNCVVTLEALKRRLKWKGNGLKMKSQWRRTLSTPPLPPPLLLLNGTDKAVASRCCSLQRALLSLFCWKPFCFEHLHQTSPVATSFNLC
jgi:hypothetical protein